jgi:hypothetical protein
MTRLTHPTPEISCFEHENQIPTHPHPAFTVSAEVRVIEPRAEVGRPNHGTQR